MAWSFRDSRHPSEIAADARIAAGRGGGVDVPVEAFLVTDTQALSGAADAIALSTAVISAKRVKMSKLGAIADRIAEKKKAHDAKADEWAARLDALDRREPDAFAIGDAVIEEREGDLRDMENTMRTLGNLPNLVSGESSKG